MRMTLKVLPADYCNQYKHQSPERNEVKFAEFKRKNQSIATNSAYSLRIFR